MKYAFMSFSCPELDLDQTLNIAKEYGYEGYEPRIDAGHDHGIELDSDKKVLAEARAKAAECDIKICCIATSCSFADPSNTRNNIEHAKQAIELAANVGSPNIRVFGGALPEDGSREKSFASIVEALMKLSVHANDWGVTVCMETHDSWCDPQVVADIMRSVRQPAIAVNWDIMHPVFTEGYSIKEAFEELKPWIRHVHMHDGIKNEKGMEFKPIGKGIVDHKTAVKLLKNAGYDGYISGEWIGWEPYEIHLPREISVLRSYEDLDRSK